MDYLKRKDMLFITVFALCALVMAVANPAAYDIRSVAWDVAMFLVAAGAVLWFFSELEDQIFSGLMVKDVYASKPRSRMELIELAEDMTGVSKEHLSKMTDIELNGLVNSSKGSSGNMASLGSIILATLRVVIKVFVTLYRGCDTGSQSYCQSS